MPKAENYSCESFSTKLFKRVKEHPKVAATAVTITLGTSLIGGCTRPPDNETDPVKSASPIATALESPSPTPSAEKTIANVELPEPMTEEEKEKRAQYFKSYEDASDEADALYYEAITGAMDLCTSPDTGQYINKYEAIANENIRAEIESFLYKLYEEVGSENFTLGTFALRAKTEKKISQGLIITASNPETSFDGKITIDGIDGWTNRGGLLPNMDEYFPTIKGADPQKAYQLFKSAIPEITKQAQELKDQGDYSRYGGVNMKIIKYKHYAKALEKIYGF